MRQYTYAEAKEKVLVDLRLQQDDSLDQDELVGYFNDAIDEAESEIHLAEREEEYFKRSAYLSLVTSTSTYSLPTDIYANKILGVTYHNGSEIYPVRRIRRMQRFLEMEEITQAGSADRYKYTIQNTDATTGVQLVLFPTSRETSSTVMKLWYIRNANRIPTIADGSYATTEATAIDIPEFITFIFAHVKVSILANMPNDPRLALHAQKLEQQRKLMTDTLARMVPDDDDIIEGDFSIYQEHQ